LEKQRNRLQDKLATEP